jgi:hypothetical protein
MAEEKPYFYYRNHEGRFGWGVRGPNLDIAIPDKGLALAIAKFLNHEPDADTVLRQLWDSYRT